MAVARPLLERIRIVLSWALVFVAGAYGLWSYPLALLGPDRSRIPGDLGDARFNNYVLEHFHRYLMGKERHYWDAPFMHPYERTLALSDNLMGTAPIYSVSRIAGFNRETSFQLWIVALFALNYFCAFLVLWRWCREPVLAACGAYLFAFGIHTVGHLHHAQVFPRFMVPVAFFHCFRWLTDMRPRHLLFTGLAVAYQFYCGIYLGFMLCYAMGALVAAYALVHRRRMFQAIRRIPVVRSCGALLVASLLLAPLMIPYAQVAGDLGTRSFEEVVSSIPRPVSYFFTHPAAVNWRALSFHSIDAFTEWWHHFHFVGALPWIAVLLAPILLIRGGRNGTSSSLLYSLLLGWGLSTLFCMRVGEVTLWRLVYHVPGFSALRSIDRIMNVQAMFFAGILVLVALKIGAHGWRRWLVPPALLVLTLLDNRVDVRELKSFDKYAAQHMVHDVERDMLMQRTPSGSVVAYERTLPVTDTATWHEQLIETHLSVMLAGQHLGIPVVNAYTGSYPGPYLSFFDRMDQRTLDAWCAFNATPCQDIVVVTNVGEPILGRDTVWILGDNERFISADADSAMVAYANRLRPREWETFLRVRLQGGRSAFVTHSGAFLCSELEDAAQLSGTSEDLGDFGMFAEAPLGDSHIALRASNGRYVRRDPLTDILRADADSIGPQCVFRIIVP